MSHCIIIEDGQKEDRHFGFTFQGNWVYDRGHGTRFHGGDEHWTSASVAGDVLPGFTFRFSGKAVSLYGHRGPEGGIASVTIDGQDAGTIDYYQPHREEKMLLYSADLPEGGAHVLRVQILPESNPAAGKTREASLDYAEVLYDDGAFPPEELTSDRRHLYLETGMSYRLNVTVLPDYASPIPPLRFVSSSPAAIVSEDGTVSVVGEGPVVITAYLEGTDVKTEISVTCAKASAAFSGRIADNGRHTDPDRYMEALEEAALEPVSEWRGTTFRNDAALVKIDLFSKTKPLHSVRARITDFVSENGSIPASSADLRFVTPTLAHDTKRYVPDCLDSRGPVELDAMTVRTLFAKIAVPKEAEPGLYTAELTVEAEDVSALTFPLTLEVLPYALPGMPERSFQLELWTYPYSCERYYSGKKTAEYFPDGIAGLPYCHLTGEADDALRSQLRLYAAAGGRAITVTCVEDPWNSQTHDPYPSMIKWHLKNGVFSFDYTDFDKWVKMNMECGIDRQIKTFSIAAWGNRVTYIDEDAGEVRTESLVPGTDRWKTVWSAFLRDYMRHTLEMGWFEKTYLSMDERGPEEIEALLDLKDSVKTPDGRSFRTSLAIFRFEAVNLYDRIDDLSMWLFLDREKLKQIAAHRRACGKLTTLYTCNDGCSALSNQPYESEYAMIYTASALGTDGFLRWALDAFNADPIASSAHCRFVAGDLYLIYPDHLSTGGREAHSSHRFEKIAEGIRFTERIRVLRQEKPECAAELDELLASFEITEEGLKTFRERFFEIARR